MPDLDSQLRTYAEWMAAEADEAVASEATPVHAVASRRRPWLAVAAAAVAIGIVGTVVVMRGSDPSPATPAGPLDPGATMREDLMLISPPIATPGSIVAAMFPEGTNRGSAFSLERREGDRWSVTHLLATGGWSGAPPTWWLADEPNRGWTDILVTGPGPDRLMLPPDLPPGEYRICTATAVENFCAPVTVEAGAPVTTTHPTPPEPAPTSNPYDPSATMREDLMVILPPIATPGSVVAAMFPEETMRGLAFSLEQSGGEGWSVTHMLVSGGSSDAEPSWWLPNDFDVVPDVGIGGPGPDRLMLPPELAPGEYRICTANSRENFCAPATVEEFAPVADTVPPGEANVTLHLSNQSFVDDPVIISVYLNGERIITDRFEVLGQHNWVTFALRLAPGDHEILITSDTGAVLVETLSIPEISHRWAVADYWHYPDDGTGESTPRSFTFSVSENPIYFD